MTIPNHSSTGADASRTRRHRDLAPLDIALEILAIDDALQPAVRRALASTSIEEGIELLYRRFPSSILFDGLEQPPRHDVFHNRTETRVYRLLEQLVLVCRDEYPGMKEVVDAWPQLPVSETHRAAHIESSARTGQGTLAALPRGRPWSPWEHKEALVGLEELRSRKKGSQISQGHAGVVSWLDDQPQVLEHVHEARPSHQLSRGATASSSRASSPTPLPSRPRARKQAGRRPAHLLEPGGLISRQPESSDHDLATLFAIADRVDAQFAGNDRPPRPWKIGAESDESSLKDTTQYFESRGEHGD